MTPSEIRDLRTRLGMTQAQLATALGLVRTGTISDWERGRSKPNRTAVLLMKTLRRSRQ